MKTNSENKCVAQGAAIWNAREEHERIMKMLDGVYGHWAYCQCDYGHGSYWTVKHLSLKELFEIMKRGHHDEIIHMIKRYGDATPPARYSQGCDQCHRYPTTDHILPEAIQELIALRNNREEMDLFLHYQGFDKCGQDVVLDRGNHDEIMHYLLRHGLQAAQQRKLRQRGNRDEFLLHIEKHGLAPELLDEMFDRIEAGGTTDEYYDFIFRRELPVEQQKRMLRTVKSPEFRAYVKRYGLWRGTHADLIEYRSEDDIFYYLEIHRYLDAPGEDKLTGKKSSRLNLLYASVRPEKEFDTIDHFLENLLSVRPLDYAALSACFLKKDYALTHSYSFRSDEEKKQEEADVRLMKEGSHKAVMERIKKASLQPKALAQLFFRNNPQEFEAYLEFRQKGFKS